MIPVLSLVQFKNFEDGTCIYKVHNGDGLFRQRLSNVTISSEDNFASSGICQLSNDLFLFTPLSHTIQLIAQQYNIQDYDLVIQVLNNARIFDENSNRVSFDTVNRLLHVPGVELTNVTMLLQFIVTIGRSTNKIIVICRQLDINSNGVLTNGGYFGLPLYKSLYDNSLQNFANAVHVYYSQD